jgi:hypothetical protein
MKRFRLGRAVRSQAEVMAEIAGFLKGNKPKTGISSAPVLFAHGSRDMRHLP